MSLLALSDCFPCLKTPPFKTYPVNEKVIVHFTDAPLPHPAPSPDDVRTAQLASEIIDTLLSAEKPGRELKRKLDDIISSTSWYESLAAAVSTA